MERNSYYVNVKIRGQWRQVAKDVSFAEAQKVLAQYPTATETSISVNPAMPTNKFSFNPYTLHITRYHC